MAKERQKRWIRYSIAALLVLTAFYAIGMQAHRNRLLKELRFVEAELERVEAERDDLRPERKLAVSQELDRSKITLPETIIEVHTISSPRDHTNFLGRPDRLRYELPLPPAEEWNSGRSPLSRSR